jgi:hypothetical protein
MTTPPRRPKNDPSPGPTQVVKPQLVDHDDSIPSPEVERGIILRALWEHRNETLTNFDKALEGLSIPFENKQGTLNLFESGGLIRYAFKPLDGSFLGNGRITLDGVQVAEKKKDAPFSIVINIQTGGVRMDNVTVGGGMNIATDQARATQNEKKSVDWAEWIVRVWEWVKAFFPG